MSTLVDRLNEILANQWACVRALRRAESQCDDPGKLEVIKRVRKDCSVSCVSLANVIRSLGGRPTDIPSTRFSLKLADEGADIIIDYFRKRDTAESAAKDRSRCLFPHAPCCG